MSLPYWSESESVNLLGAVTEDGETFYAEVDGSFDSDVTERFLAALQEEFGEHLHVVLDNASYFVSNQVADYIDDTEMEVTYFPTGSPDLNPVEECWRQLKRTLGNRLFPSEDALRAAVHDALDDVNPPQTLTDYFCPLV